MSTALPIIQEPMLQDEVEGPRATRSLWARDNPLAPPARQMQVLTDLKRGDGQGYEFERTLADHGLRGLHPAALEYFQVNLGKLCNMTCRHCHVDAGPDRTEENMDLETVQACLRALDQTSAHTVDLTGGAPELNPHFRFMVEESKKRGKHVIDRCNLTILLANRMKDLPEWLAEHEVEVVCSLPHHNERNTDAQRGEGTFERSIEALRRLNEVGYGRGDPKRRLTLMSNPAGAFLAGSQAAMEREWKQNLDRRHGVVFDRLIALNNMPIARFLEWLLETRNLEAYMERLVNAFNPGAVDGLMCRNTISIGWDGLVYDCDFNQMLDMRLETSPQAHLRIQDFEYTGFQARRVLTAPHCYGCTAGAGSSCGGATA